MTADIATTEQEIIGAALTDPRILPATRINGEHFNSPMLGAIWDAMRAIHADKLEPTPALIIDRAEARIDPSIFPEVAGLGVPINADTYASQILDAHRRRGISNTLIRASQALDTGMATDEIVSRLTSQISDATNAEQDAEDLLTIDEFVDQELPPEQWIIPGLFAVGERAIITGGEGLGKSMLMRQMALCAAAGYHPFTFTRFQPARVLIIDAENPKPIMVRKFKGIRDMLTEKGRPAVNCWVKRYPQGMDLAESRDRLALHNLCMLTRPELLVIGPAYKLYVGGSNSREEDLARMVTKVLDGLREEFGFALMLEHHSPHENAQTGKRAPRPIGSSLWRRWPEYGFGLVGNGPSRDAFGRLQRSVEIKHWRGQREDRPWPTQLESGGRLPWTVSDPTELETITA